MAPLSFELVLVLAFILLFLMLYELHQRISKIESKLGI